MFGWNGVALVCVLAFAGAGCRAKKYENPITKDTQQPDKVLFDKAVRDIERGRYEVARLTLNTLMNTYDTSEFLAKAKLAIADSWFREGGSHALAQADKLGQLQAHLKVEGKGQHTHAFEVEPFAFEQVGDAQFEAFGHLPAHALGEGDDMGGQQAFEESELFGEPAQAAPGVVIIGVECFPLVDAVHVRAFGQAQAHLIHVQSRDPQRSFFPPDAQAPVGLSEEAVGFFHAVLQAQEHGAHVAAPGIEFVLYQGIALVVAAGFVVVVVKPLVFETYFLGHRAAKPGKFPGLQFGIESDRKESKGVRHLV